MKSSCWRQGSQAVFEIGRLSSGRAAELAGMSRVEFLLNLNRFKVFPLAAELDELEAKHA